MRFQLMEPRQREDNVAVLERLTTIHCASVEEVFTEAKAQLDRPENASRQAIYRRWVDGGMLVLREWS